MEKRNQYTEEFKREAVALMESRGTQSVAEVARAIGVAASQLFQWRKQYSAEIRRNQNHETPEQEIMRLQRDNARLRRERDLLKKSIAFFVNDRD